MEFVVSFAYVFSATRNGREKWQEFLALNRHIYFGHYHKLITAVNIARIKSLKLQYFESMKLYENVSRDLKWCDGRYLKHCMHNFLLYSRQNLYTNIFVFSEKSCQYRIFRAGFSLK